MALPGKTDDFQGFQDSAKQETIVFAREHQGEDTARLLFSASRYPSIDMPLAVQQIEGLRTAREKWPSLLNCEEFLYPPLLNREQASSEATAWHKAALCFPHLEQSGTKPLRIADLTGGMGIDTFALAGWGSEYHVEAEVDYVEQNPELCELTRNNAKVLGLGNIHVHCCDSMEWLQRQRQCYDLIFIDPARRDKQGRKVAAFEDCTPDILSYQELLLSKGKNIMVKASPMIDISLGVKQLQNISDIYVVAVHGECKEVLFLCGRYDREPRIHCHHLHHGEADKYLFSRDEENDAQALYANEAKKYLYEPNAALMKAGPFKLLSQTEKVEKLARNTHLYTSDTYLQHFPGRIFSVLTETKLTRKEIQKWVPDGHAHVVTRNYPMEAAALQRQLGLKEGGDLFVIATTIGTRKACYICCLPKNYQHFSKEMNK